MSSDPLMFINVNLLLSEKYAFIWKYHSVWSETYKHVIVSTV